LRTLDDWFPLLLSWLEDLQGGESLYPVFSAESLVLFFVAIDCSYLCEALEGLRGLLVYRFKVLAVPACGKCQNTSPRKKALGREVTNTMARRIFFMEKSISASSEYIKKEGKPRVGWVDGVLLDNLSPPASLAH